VDLLAVATVKPIDERALAASASKTKAVLAVEEHNVTGLRRKRWRKRWPSTRRRRWTSSASRTVSQSRVPMMP